VVQVATSALLSKVVHRMFSPSLNVTVPSGGIGSTPEATTWAVAVRVMLWPTSDGFVLEARDVDVPSTTTWMSASDVLGKWVGSRELRY